MNRSLTLGLALLALVGSACSSSSDDTPATIINTTSCQQRYWNGAQPPCTVAVNFSVDDHLNMVYTGIELQWKGSFRYDALTRLGFLDPTWNGGNGPFAPLYDDGPWDVSSIAGHEPHGSVKGDHIFGVTMFVPVTGAAQNFEYGLVDHAFGDGWIWRGASNGTFTVPANATAPITALGQAFPAFGTNDVRLTLDVASLDAAFTASTSDLTVPKVKGSAWGWNLIDMVDDGTKGDVTAADGIYTFVLSEYAGLGKMLFHTGLADHGDRVQFVFTLGAANKEYKVSGVPPQAGVAGAYKPSGGSFTAATVANLPTGDQNTYIDVP